MAKPCEEVYINWERYKRFFSLMLEDLIENYPPRLVTTAKTILAELEQVNICEEYVEWREKWWRKLEGLYVMWMD